MSTSRLAGVAQRMGPPQLLDYNRPQCLQQSANVKLLDT